MYIFQRLIVKSIRIGFNKTKFNHDIFNFFEGSVYLM